VPLYGWVLARMSSLAERQAELKNRLQQEKTGAGKKERNTDTWCEQHYTVPQLASMWAMSPETVRRMVEHEPDVMRVGEGESRNKRRYYTYYIPESVARRVHAQACCNR
jgi:hypothetical protein